jgi:[ribosomal protein S5]-alanine N-acetyltransferase
LVIGSYSNVGQTAKQETPRGTPPRGLDLFENSSFQTGQKLAKFTVMNAVVLLPMIETPTLLLREMQSLDAADLAAFMTQARYQRHIAHRLRDEAAVTDFVRRQVAVQGDRRRQIFHLAAEEKLSGDVVGEGFLIAHGNNDFEIGWGVHPAMWSMGLGTEIGRALLAMAFERLKAVTVWCKIMRANGSSLTVARRVGLTDAGSQADYPVGQGRYEKVCIYRLSMQEYYDLPY